MKNLLILSLIFFGMIKIFSLENKIDKILETTSNQTISVKVMDGSLKIKAWDKNEVWIKGNFEKNVDKIRFDEQSNNILIKSDIKNNLKNRKNIRVFLEIFVPKENDINIDLINAECEITGVEKNISVTSTSGNIKINSNSKDVDIVTINGNVELKGNSNIFQGTSINGNFLIDGDCNILKIKTSSGNINLTETLVKNINIFSTNGEIKIKGLKFDKSNCEIINIRGNILFLIPQEESIQIMIKSISGKVKINKNDFDEIYKEEKSFKIKKGSGESVVFLETMIGEIEIITQINTD